MNRKWLYVASPVFAAALALVASTLWTFTKDLDVQRMARAQMPRATSARAWYASGGDEMGPVSVEKATAIVESVFRCKTGSARDGRDEFNDQGYRIIPASDFGVRTRLEFLSRDGDVVMALAIHQEQAVFVIPQGDGRVVRIVVPMRHECAVELLGDSAVKEG